MTYPIRHCSCGPTSLMTETLLQMHCPSSKPTSRLTRRKELHSPAYTTKRLLLRPHLNSTPKGKDINLSELFLPLCQYTINKKSYEHTKINKINTCNEKKSTMNLLPTAHSFYLVAVQSKAKMNSVMT